MIMSQSADVQTMVLNALHWDLAVPRHRLKVEVENRWVTMSGMHGRSALSAHMRRVRRAQGSWRGRRQQSYSARASAGAKQWQGLWKTAKPHTSAGITRQRCGFGVCRVTRGRARSGRA